MVVEIEGTSVELTGSAEAQYEEWRAILKEIYQAESDYTLPATDGDGG
jgi:hypothetical protein